MRFIETLVEGAILIDIEPREDDRGFFARVACEDDFAEHGLHMPVAQTSIGFNRTRGTLRGLHFQREPHAETKLLRCVRGELFAVAADLRPGSPTYLRHVGVILSADNRRSLYVPPGCATGYQTLADDTEISYQISPRHAPGFEAGVHHRDPALAIPWPLEVTRISERDEVFPTVERVSAA